MKEKTEKEEDTLNFHNVMSWFESKALWHQISCCIPRPHPWNQSVWTTLHSSQEWFISRWQIDHKSRCTRL